MLQQCDITTCHAQPEAGGFIPWEAIGGRYYVDGDMILAQTESPEKITSVSAGPFFRSAQATGMS
jgi:hypothetical protein